MGWRVVRSSVMTAEAETHPDPHAEPSLETTDLANRYGYDPRLEGDRCPNCSATFVFHDEETTLEPTCAVFVCDHHYLRNEDCQGSRIKVYDDGFVSRLANPGH